VDRISIPTRLNAEKTSLLSALQQGSFYGFAILYVVIVIALLGFFSTAYGQTAQSVTGNNQGTSKEMGFEVFSIRPRADMPTSWSFGPTPTGFASSLSLWQAIMLAYAPERPQAWFSGNGSTHVRNLPKWAEDWYDINARVSENDFETWQTRSRQPELLRSALRAALQERCKLVIREQPTEVPDYQLLIRKGGPNLKTAVQDSALPQGMRLASGGVAVANPNTRFYEHFYRATMDDLVAYLAVSSDRPIRNMTGLSGIYDFRLPHIIEEERSNINEERVRNFMLDHLGLELKVGKGPGLDLIVEHIEKPDPN
jgi:uncharacterized protein (TIGR03435 family)